MSGFINNPAHPLQHIENDWRAVSPYWQREAMFRECISAIAPPSFANEFWPGGGNLLGDSGTDVGCCFRAVWWGIPDPASGSASRFGVTGVTRDQYGSVLGGVTVKLFRTSEDLKLDQTVSDPTTGEYLCNTPYYPDTNYLVFYKAGSPDVFGTSANTLIAS